MPVYYLTDIKGVLVRTGWHVSVETIQLSKCIQVNWGFRA